MEDQHIYTKIGDSKVLEIDMEWAGEPFTYDPIWGGIWTFKKYPRDLDPAALIQKASGVGLTFSGSKAYVALVPQDTLDLSEFTGTWDIQLQNTDTGEVRTVALGKLRLDRDITRLLQTSIPIYTTEEPAPFGGIPADGTGLTDPENWRELLELDQVDNTSDADKPVSDATAEALSLKASSALQRPNEQLASSLIFHDDMGGDNTTLAQAGTRNASPGPGVWTVGAATNQSVVRIEGGRMRLINLPLSTGYVQINGAAIPAAAGLTMEVRLVPSMLPGTRFCKTKIGFTSATTGYPDRRGVISFEKTVGWDTLARLTISLGTTNATDGLYSAGLGISNPGEEVALRVNYKTLTHQEYWFQGGNCGCPVGGATWFKLGETFMDLTSVGNVYPFLGHEHAGVTEVREVKIYNSATASPRSQSFDYSRTLQGIHIPTIGRDPQTELAILGWNRGAIHVGPGESEIRASVRLASGLWTTPVTLMAAPTAPAGQCINSFSILNGVMHMIYWKSATGTDGGVLYKRTVTINPTTGGVTLGAEASLGIAGSLNLNFSPAITLRTGRVLLPYHKGLEGTPNYMTYIAHSDDGGATWTSTQITPTMPAGTSILGEPTVVEFSSGVVGCFMRSSARSAFFSRCLAPGGPGAAAPVWTTPTLLPSIPQPPGTGSRMNAMRRADGTVLLIGNDSKTYRRNITMWEMGDAGEVLDKTFVADWNPINDALAVSQLQYPVMLDDGDDVTIAYSHQESGGVNLTMQIRTLTMRYTQPVPREGGGSGRRDRDRVLAVRPVPNLSQLDFSNPVPDMTFGGDFAISLTASTATIGAPLNPLPNESLAIIATQAGSGGYTLAFNAIYEFGGVMPPVPTAIGASRAYDFRFNAASNKWIYTGGGNASAATVSGLGTLATQNGTFSGTSSGTNTGDQASIVGISGTIEQFNAALTGADFATLAGTETLTNKTISAADNTLQRIPMTVSNDSDFSTTSTTFVNVTGMSFPVLANKNYAVVINLCTNKNDANGIQIQLTGPASPVRVMVRYGGSGASVNAFTTDFVMAFASAATTFNTFNGDGAIGTNIGQIDNGTNAGTVQLQLRAVTGGTAKIYAGSWIQITQLN